MSVSDPGALIEVNVEAAGGVVPILSRKIGLQADPSSINRQYPSVGVNVRPEIPAAGRFEKVFTTDRVEISCEKLAFSVALPFTTAKEDDEERETAEVKSLIRLLDMSSSDQSDPETCKRDASDDTTPIEK